MSNRYANLVGSNKIKDEYTKINTGFDRVQEEMDAKPDASFAQVNDIAASADDTLTIEGGTGITVTTVPEEKKLRITATGDATPGLHGIEHNHDGADPIPELVQVREDLASHKAEDVTQGDTPHGIIYEAGTWTPVLGASNVDGQHTYQHQNGYYTRIGRVVHLSGYIQLVSKDPSMSGTPEIKGIPFAAGDQPNNRSSQVALSGNVSLSGNYNVVGLGISAGSPSLRLYKMGPGVVETFLGTSDITDTSKFWIDISYFV